jgi:hypothetical protein
MPIHQKTVRLDFFDAQLRVVLSTPVLAEKVRIKMSKWLGVNAVVGGDARGWTCSSVGGSRVGVVLFHPVAIDTVVHEAVHAADELIGRQDLASPRERHARASELRARATEQVFRHIHKTILEGNK